MLKVAVWPPNLSFTWFFLISGGLGSTAYELGKLSKLLNLFWASASFKMEAQVN